MLQRILLVIGLVLLAGNLCLAQILGLGNCPIVPVVQNFVPASYMGVWFEQEKYPFLLEFNTKCVSVSYTQAANEQMTVVIRQASNFGSIESSITGNAKIVSSGVLAVNFAPVPGFNANYQILATDYTSYAVVFSCTDLGFFHSKVAWIKTRDRVPTQAILNQAHAALDAANISRTSLTTTNQLDCVIN